MGIFPIYDSLMSRSVAKPSPAMAPSVATSVSAEAVVKSISTLLRPLVKLAIKVGLKYAELDQLLKEALHEEAQKQCSAKDRSNASKLSMMTGLHRKEVASRLARSSVEHPTEPRPDAHSAARRVFKKWLRALQRNAERARIPIDSNGKRGLSFYGLVRENISDVHPRSVLDELVRLGLVVERDGFVSIADIDFSAKSSAEEKMPVFTHNLNAHLVTSVENILATRPAQLERSVWIENISQEDAQRIEEIARSKWRTTHDAVYDAMRSAPSVEDDSSPRYRISVGTYVCYEPA